MKHRYLIGIDEVGRGPLAGPVTLAALVLLGNFQLSIFPPSLKLQRASNFQIKDSKQLTPKERNEIYKILQKLKKEEKINFSVSHVKHSLIDKMGLTRCIYVGIERCLSKLQLDPKRVQVLLDGGLKAPEEFKNQKTIIKGDEKIKIIALASIVAKVCRDRRMCRLAKKYPEYNFEINKGYGTMRHYQALRKYGLCEIHRRSFLKNLNK